MYTTMGGETCENVTRSGCYAATGGAAMTDLARTQRQLQLTIMNDE
jgi:hypothetical protein